MPIYEYQCGACGHTLETLQKISDSPLTRCPECGEDALKKLISAPAFRLKGSGWYETDFKTGNKKNVAQSDKSGSDKSSSGKSSADGSKSGTDSKQKK
jgi:putative FmdB family regulatory protein